MGLKRYREAEEACRALLAIWTRITPSSPSTGDLVPDQGRDWRGALEAALNATRLDRFDLTTAFLAYAKDRLFTRVPTRRSARRNWASGSAPNWLRTPNCTGRT